MSPSAQRHQQAFARLAGDPRSALYLREFLSGGWGSWPDELRHDYDELEGWRGLDTLKSGLQKLFDASSKTRVEVASRSGMLFSLAARRLTRRCKRLLVADTLWPPYRDRLRVACRRRGSEAVVCPLRETLRRVGCSHDAIVDLFASEVRTRRCEGLVLPLVDHRGVLLPVKDITRHLRSEGRPVSVLLDASQAVGHVPLVLRGGWCDALVAGTHKWLGGGNPLGFSITEPSLAEQLGSEPPITDPLWRFAEELAGKTSPRWGETAGVLALLTAAGALADSGAGVIKRQLPSRLAAKRDVARLARREGWSCSAASEGSRTGVLVASPPVNATRQRIEACLRDHGVVATVTNGKAVRFSFPASGLASDRIGRVERILRSLGKQAASAG